MYSSRSRTRMRGSGRRSVRSRSPPRRRRSRSRSRSRSRRTPRQGKRTRRRSSKRRRRRRRSRSRSKHQQEKQKIVKSGRKDVQKMVHLLGGRSRSRSLTAMERLKILRENEAQQASKPKPVQSMKPMKETIKSIQATMKNILKQKPIQVKRLNELTKKVEFLKKQAKLVTSTKRFRYRRSPSECSKIQTKANRQYVPCKRKSKYAQKYNLVQCCKKYRKTKKRAASRPHKANAKKPRKKTVKTFYVKPRESCRKTIDGIPRMECEKKAGRKQKNKIVSYTGQRRKRCCVQRKTKKIVKRPQTYKSSSTKPKTFKDTNNFGF